MKKSVYLTLWGILFALCAGLGLLPEPSGIGKALMTFLSVVFFLPPFFLLHQAKKAADLHTMKLIRNLSGLSLLLTLILLVGNFLSVLAGQLLGTVLYYVLVIVSSPMVCSGYWALSLFLWACLLTVSRQMLRAK